MIEYICGIYFINFSGNFPNWMIENSSNEFKNLFKFDNNHLRRID